MASVLPEAIKMSRERGDQLTQALRPAVEGSFQQSIDQKPQLFVEALHPLIGPIVRKSVAETLRRLLQSFNQTLEHTFSWRGLKWRWEALRTGRSFAEVVMLRSLVYRVEQLFLIHRETSLSLLHVTADATLSKDSDMVAGMLSAIQDFARDSFATGEDSDLEEFRVGELQVWIAPGPHAYLAAVIRGNPSLELRPTLEETIETVHVLKGSALAEFKGDAAPFESLRPELESCLRAQYATVKKEGKSTRAWIFILLIAALAASGLIIALRNHSKWKDFLHRLRAQPGLVVTEARKGWFGLRERPTLIPRKSVFTGMLSSRSTPRVCDAESNSDSSCPIRPASRLMTASWRSPGRSLTSGSKPFAMKPRSFPASTRWWNGTPPSSTIRRWRENVSKCSSVCRTV